MEVLWSDGRKFPIDYVIDIKQRPSQKALGFGSRYRVSIHGKERYMFLEPDAEDVTGVGRWFVEEPVRQCAAVE